MTARQPFAYRGRRADGGVVADVIYAPDRRAALLQLETEGIVPLSLHAQDSAVGPALLRRRVDIDADRLLVLQQVAVLTGAGIPLLEALEAIADSLAGRPIATRIAAAVDRLRQGDTIAQAFRAGLPGYPAHVYALIGVGEANGNLGAVLDEAVRQMRYAETLRRDVLTALSYPAFLIVAALVAFAFLFVVVVPRFAEMIGPARETIGGLSGFILGVGVFVQANPVAAPVLSLALAAGAIYAGATAAGRRHAARLLADAPIVGGLIVANHRAEWARIMALAVSSGVGILDAAALSFDAVPEGRFRRQLNGSIGALRAGRPIAEAFGASGAVDRIDMSLLQTGQTSGRLGAMLAVIADRHEGELRTAMKRVTSVLEQVAVALVATVIGAVVLGLVGAMTSVYETLG
ncbi:MAG: type II secretion system F family protein [Hyphomonadaceae bacterium]|nr:type II secretion system F family protein [Hyphomonadaceae bacterium]